MLKKRKKVKIIMTIIALILALGLFINCQKIDINKETYAPTMNLATAEEIRLAATTIGLEHGTINPIYRPQMGKNIKFNRHNKQDVNSKGKRIRI